jgi:hypothetical protein
MAYTKYSLTPADNNAAPPDGAPEGMLPSAVNDTMRDMMAQIRDVGDGVRDGTYTMTAPVITGGSVSGVTSVSTSGNLTFTGTGNRITGLMDGVTIANILAFQTSTTDGGTRLSIVSNGTGTASSLDVYGISDPTNAASLRMRTSAADASIRSDITGTGTYLPLTMFTGGSERLRIDTSGNVGIGTSSPAYQLHISGTAPRIEMTDTDTGASSYISASSANGSFVLAADESNVSASSVMAFRVDATERMRIDSRGFVGIGILPQTILDLRVPNSGNCLRISNVSGTAAYNAALFYNNGLSSLVGNITVSGSTTSYVTSSDYRLKENIAPMTGALDVVQALKPVTYNWKADGSSGQGFIAHELQEVVPDCVTGEKDAVDAEGKPVYQGIDTSFLVATLTAAIQELKATVDAQAARISALENK